MLFFFVLSLLLPHIFCDQKVICGEYSQHISCASNQVIRISSAQLQIPATNAVKHRCEGRQKCKIIADNNLVDNDNPCSGTNNHLDIHYTCEINSANVKVCEGDRLVIDCPENNLIRVISAIYGRHTTTHCNFGAANFINCGLDETSMVKTVCDGLQSCNMEAGIQIFQIDPCVGTNKYTDVDYVCEPKIPGEQRHTACDGQTFSISCDSPAKIQVIQATYGRTSSKICPSPGADRYTQCASNRTSDISQRCNGHKSCSFSVDLPPDPCLGIYKYLNVRYLCK